MSDKKVPDEKPKYAPPPLSAETPSPKPASEYHQNKFTTCQADSQAHASSIANDAIA